MSSAQSNIELNNNRMEEIIKNVDHIFGYVLLYSVIILTTLSAILGGVLSCPIYTALYIYKKIKANTCKKEDHNEVEIDAHLEIDKKLQEIEVKKPLIDENWCNVNIKNIIDYEKENLEFTLASLEAEINLEEDIAHISANVEEEILSLKIPEVTSESEEDTSEGDNSPKDKYSLRYKQDEVDLTN